MKRRAVLGALGASAVGGCTSLPGTEGGCSNAEATSPPPCQRDDAERFDPAYGTPLGETSDSPFALHVSEPRVSVGDRIVFTLTNAAWFSSAQTGNRLKYTIDRLVDDGWRSIYVDTESDDVLRFTDEAISHGGREGFAWEFTATTDGLDHDQEGLVVCPDVRPGWYRFVYWGLGESSLGVCFEITEG